MLKNITLVKSKKINSIETIFTVEIECPVCGNKFRKESGSSLIYLEVFCPNCGVRQKLSSTRVKKRDTKGRYVPSLLLGRF